MYVQEKGEFTLKCKYVDALNTGVQWYFKGSKEGDKDGLIDASEGTGFSILNEKEVRLIPFHCYALICKFHSVTSPNSYHFTKIHIAGTVKGYSI